MLGDVVAHQKGITPHSELRRVWHYRRRGGIINRQSPSRKHGGAWLMGGGPTSPAEDTDFASGAAGRNKVTPKWRDWGNSNSQTTVVIELSISNLDKVCMEKSGVVAQTGDDHADRVRWLAGWVY